VNCSLGRSDLLSDLESQKFFQIMKSIIIFSILSVAIADLRQASQPKKAFGLLQQGGTRNGAQNFAVGTGQNNDGTINNQNKGKVLWMEPSVFGYNGLKNQRKNNYDNFLRSNIDNEQDNRNFNNEAGKDHLPFRTYDGAAPVKYPYKGNEAGAGDGDDSLQRGVRQQNVDTVLTVKAGEPRLTPLRWNNPHASEVEVNLWIMCSNPPTIVPVKKPACSGEGNQNNIIEWAIPSDFNSVDWKACASTKCFNGCKTGGDCVLQIYAHSVETRQYSTAVPIVITGETFTGTKLGFKATPGDSFEADKYVWPDTFDLSAMVKGKEPGDPRSQNPKTDTGTPVSINDVRICASSEREATTDAGNKVDELVLKATGTAEKLNSPQTHLYICKASDKDKAAEKLIDKVVFQVTTSADGTTYTAAGTKTENYTPFEYSSTNHFGGAALKKVKATITPYAGAAVVKEVLLDLRAGGRWRFRRHLKSVCAGGAGVLKEPFPDPWMDLSKLKRETCLSAQDQNANYPTTTIQRAALHSDVANHAYQNSNYSPYSGQQHGEISRNMQAAAVIHMTSGNRGELGKNSIPNAVKQKLKQLNKAVNKIYKAYEKVANKVIDDLTGNGGKNGGAVTMGVQKLGSSFRSAEKGATSTKRLKTTTYVPSFSTAGYNDDVIRNAIKARTGGNKATYKDILKANPQTGKSYIKIYESAMWKMLPAFKEAEALGITYMPSVQTIPCSVIKDDTIKAASQKSLGLKRTAVACCDGSMQNAGTNSCSRTMADTTNFKKKNQNGNRNDGGLYAARTFATQRYMSLYGCPSKCLLQTANNANLAKAITKTSKGTCITAINGNQCVPIEEKTASSIDCTGCNNIFNNVAPQPASTFSIGKPGAGADAAIRGMIRSVLKAPPEEPLAPVLKAEGYDDLDLDDTAVCHTESTFDLYCGKGEAEPDFVAEADYEKKMKEEKCGEKPSIKKDHMCEDGPCDSDPDSDLCKLAKSKCLVDPETGVKCWTGDKKGTENDPCKLCVVVAGAATSFIAFTSVLIAALVM